MSYHGRFMPNNINKYKGDVNNIWFRSLWERKVMVNLDTWPAVIEWSSEEIIVPYRSPIDNRIHRYFPDFQAKLDQGNGATRTVLIEVKPKDRLKPPKKPKRQTRRYIGECLEWAKNQAKFAAAEAFCADRGWTFMIMTEDHIFNKPTK